MYTMRTYCRLYVWMGLLFFLIGLCGESLSGILLLQGGDLGLLPLHVCSVLIWASGINLLYNQGAPQGGSPANWRTFVNKWGISALLLGLFTFPGSGTLAYSFALALAALLRGKMGAVSQEHERTVENIPVSAAALVSVPSSGSRKDIDSHRLPGGKVYIPNPNESSGNALGPIIDALEGTNIETKRLAVATLSRQATPEATQALRQLLLDPHAEIRTDASIALTSLEERFSRMLNSSLEQWMENPSDRECTLNLADQYYQYALSNVLDEASQHFYIVKAYDLLQQVAMQGARELDFWLKLARLCQRLNKFEEALQAIRVALQLSPHTSDAYLLAMELAFSLRDWESLVAFACEGLDALPEASEEVAECLRWWATLQVQEYGEAVHA
jgi:tetratricopeptide (TPR) repeat protein